MKIKLVKCSIVLVCIVSLVVLSCFITNNTVIPNIYSSKNSPTEIDNPTDVLLEIEEGELGFYNTTGYAHALAISGDVAYVADDHQGLRCINISDPTNPSEIGFYKAGLPEWQFFI